MNLEDFYKQIDGDYSEVLSRLLKVERIKKFLLRLPEKKDFIDLMQQIESKNYENAFIIAHTLKGMSLNLGIESFSKKISALTEFLRPRKIENDDDYKKLLVLYNEALAEFNRVCDLIRQIDN